ncbi:bifunctional nuclease family protein [Brevibacterium sp. UMB10442]|uniref:BFN domain-containing protein n=2 Tax=Brevibacterium TaxID=1696 RepID=D4YKH2_9MICO|nr:bifunctional nuclease family protein [Brevibacterium mcbrellneri]EFG48175.1 hypothetical protein HMPREF0183_0432 [Brevibacterium mcbrellneri ATCC 49030]MDK7750236.1 bifunctional nuclease family protein [Brevibacterium sp. UMB10442]
MVHIEVEVVGIRVEMPANQRVLLLKGVDVPKFLPIWIGAQEANAIGIAERGWEPPRPLSHNLLVDIIEAFGTELDRVVITHRDGHIIYSELHLSDGKVISARPSDAVAMALISQCTIETTQELLDDIGIDAPQADEEEVAQFREFLDHVSPEDFD